MAPFVNRSGGSAGSQGHEIKVGIRYEMQVKIGRHECFIKLKVLEVIKSESGKVLGVVAESPGKNTFSVPVSKIGLPLREIQA